MKAATMESAVSGFRCTGIVQFNCTILPASEFLVDPKESPIVTGKDPSNNGLSTNGTESVDTGTTITTLMNTSPILPLPSSEPNTSYVNSKTNIINSLNPNPYSVNKFINLI